MATPYQNVAKEALMNWNGLSAEEANIKIQTESISQLESQVYAMSSMKYAVVGIAKQAGLTENETTRFFDAVINGPETSEIFEVVSKKIKGLTEQQKLEILSSIHDGWVVTNSDEKTFNKKIDRQQLHQYTPLELIGWNEVKSDLLFLTPILTAVGVPIDEKQLAEAYYIKVENYMKTMKINGPTDLIALISSGQNYYPILPIDLESKLVPMSEIVSNQVVKNWIEKDPKIIQIMKSRQESFSTGKKI